MQKIKFLSHGFSNNLHQEGFSNYFMIYFEISVRERVRERDNDLSNG